MADGFGSHWEGCWETHHECACIEIGRLKDKLFVVEDHYNELRRLIDDGGDISHAQALEELKERQHEEAYQISRRVDLGLKLDKAASLLREAISLRKRIGFDWESTLSGTGWKGRVEEFLRG